MSRKTIISQLVDEYKIMWQVDLTDHQRDGLEGVLRKLQNLSRDERFAAGMNAAAYLADHERQPELAAIIRGYRDVDSLAGDEWSVPMLCAKCDGTGCCDE